MTNPDNQPAFPRTSHYAGNFVTNAQTGMSMRDWFAAHAPEPNDSTMNSQRAFDRNRNPHNDAHKPRARTDHEIRAALAFAYADAMCAERKKGQTDAG